MWAAVAVLLLTKTALSAITDQCDPLLNWYPDDDANVYRRPNPCLFPMPNDFHTILDQSTPTGKRIRLRASPKAGTDLNQWGFRDGWSPSGSIIVSGLMEEIRVPYRGVKFDCSRDCSLDYPTWEQGKEPWFSSHMNIAGLDEDNGGACSKHAFVDSGSIILDTTTGRPVAHWVELDRAASAFDYDDDLNLRSNHQDQLTMMRSNAFDTITGKQQTLVIHPASQLEHGRRYIVALKDLRSASRRDINGNPQKIAANPGFLAVRDGSMANATQLLQERRRHFLQNRIFEQLIECGFVRTREELTLAWDFTTSSLLTSTEHLRFMRDDGTRRLTKDARFSYTVHRSLDYPNQWMARKVEGSFLTPIYLKTTTPSVKSRFEFTGGGADFAENLQPRFQFMANVSFTIWIPRSVLTSRNGSVILYGHGLFKSRKETEDRYLQQLADENGYSVISLDWWGLQPADIPMLSTMLATDISRFRGLGERCSQAILNFLLMAKVLRFSGMVNDAKIFSFGGSSVLETRSTNGKIEPANIFFNGNSLGGIFGTTVMALSQDIKVACLGVPGGPFELLFPRNPAGALVINQLMRPKFPSRSQRILILYLLYQFWELADPLGYTAVLRDGKILGAKPGMVVIDPVLGRKKLLFQLALGDGQVNRVAGLYLARSIRSHIYPNDPCEFAHYLPSGGQVYRSVNTSSCDQLPTILHSSGLAAHVTTSFKFQQIPYIVPFDNIPPSMNDGRFRYNSHEWLRRASEAQTQMRLFFAEYIEQNRRLVRFEDDRVWAISPCGANGCWNISVPNY